MKSSSWFSRPGSANSPGAKPREAPEEGEAGAAPPALESSLSGIDAWLGAVESDPLQAEGKGVILGPGLLEPTQTTPEVQNAEVLRELLGESARNISDADLALSVDPQDVDKAKEMGLTVEQVDAAKLELQDVAREEGRPPESVDSVVALEALVGQERALEDLEREEPQFDRTQAEGPVDAAEREEEKEEERKRRAGGPREEEEHDKEGEREMEMDGGD